jgi:hypothetical protein
VVVVVNWHGCQLTVVSEVVPPVTVAVSVVDCPTIMIAAPVEICPTEELTVTVTVFVVLLLPPQPAVSEAAIIMAAMELKIVRNLIQPPPK